MERLPIALLMSASNTKGGSDPIMALRIIRTTFPANSFLYWCANLQALNRVSLFRDLPEIGRSLWAALMYCNCWCSRLARSDCQVYVPKISNTFNSGYSLD